MLKFDPAELPRTIYSHIPVDVVKQHLALDQSPIPNETLRQNYFRGRDFEYWLSGLSDYRHVINNLRPFGFDIGSCSEIFEMGASSGRVARHFACAHPQCTVHISDLIRDQIKWASSNLSGNIDAFTAEPDIVKLPFPTGSIDMVMAFSVFTHIDSLEEKWLREINRVIRKGGFAYLTVHSEENWDACLSIPWKRESMSKYLQDFSIISPGTPMPIGGKTAFYMKSNPNYATVFHRKEYIRDVWGRIMKLRNIVVAEDVAVRSSQTAIILQK